MGLIHDRGDASEAAPWDGPFAPTIPNGSVRIDPMVKTAAELTDVVAHADVVTPAPAVAA